MSYVVTGATGHLGRLVVESLLARGIESSAITAAGRDLSKIEDLAARGVRTVAIDFADPASLDAAFSGAEAVLLVSGSEVGRRVAQHTAAVDAAVRAGARLVYTSAPKADTTSLVLAPEHKATEEVITASGIPFTILRNNWYNENYVDTVKQAVATGTLLASTGSGRVASASRADFAEAAAVVLIDASSGNRILELGGDVAWDFSEFAAIISEVSGTSVAFHDVETPEHVQILTGVGLDEGTAGFVAALDAGIREGALAGDGDGVLSGLIGHPTTPIRTTVAEILAV